MPALQLGSVAFAQPYDISQMSSILSRDFLTELDLSKSTLVEVLQKYMERGKKKNPKYSNTPVTGHIIALEKEVHRIIMPWQVCDDFYRQCYLWLIQKGIRPSTIEGYFVMIRAALTWSAKHGCRLSESYGEFDIKKYSRTKVALTPDDVSLIAHFDIKRAFTLKDEDFLARAQKRLVVDINKEEQRREREKEKKTAHAQKVYNTAVAAAERLYKERLARENITEYKTRKAKSLYVAELQRAKSVLDIKIAEAERIAKPLTDEDKDRLLKERMTKMKNQCESNRRVKIENLERVRDQFVIQCSLGQRYSDICRITPTCFSDDLNTFTIVQQKTGHKAVVNIPKFAFDKKVVRQILVKYGCYAPYPHNISNFNRKLKELVKLIGFHDKVKSENKILGQMVIEEEEKNNIITSHTARRSFATHNFNEREYSEIAVRRATGHTDGRSFERYIIFDEE